MFITIEKLKVFRHFEQRACPICNKCLFLILLMWTSYLYAGSRGKEPTSENFHNKPATKVRSSHGSKRPVRNRKVDVFKVSEDLKSIIYRLIQCTRGFVHLPCPSSNLVYKSLESTVLWGHCFTSFVKQKHVPPPKYLSLFLPSFSLNCFKSV